MLGQAYGGRLPAHLPRLLYKNFKQERWTGFNVYQTACYQGRSQNPALQRRKLQVQGMGEPETYDVPANMRFIITRHWTTLFAGLELELVARVV